MTATPLLPLLPVFVMFPSHNRNISNYMQKNA